jgi:glutamyl-tRNA synthetase
MAAGVPSGYDNLCAKIDPEEARRRIAAGERHTVRMRVPNEGDCVFQDILRGEITTPWRTVDAQVLMKSDGFPTYHLAAVIDDHLMRISHVIRGEEWISSTPKHILLYQYFGWEPPEFCHLPLLRNPDKSKLSKRKNPTSINYYRRAGFLPEAVVNYLGLMGYTLPDGREVFTLEEFVETFDIRRVSLGGPVFDLVKLSWLNGRYLREKMDGAQLLARLKEWLLNDETLMRIMPLAQPRIEKLSDFVPMTTFFFADRLSYDPQLLVAGKIAPDQVVRLLKIAQWEMEKLRKWDREILQTCLTNIAEKEGMKLREATAPFFVAMSGAPASTPLFDSMAILGSDMTRRRIAYALEGLAGIGVELKGKQLKELEKHYQENYCLRPACGKAEE